MDVHVPAVITRTLMTRGVNVLTAQADGGARLAEATSRQRAGIQFAGVVYAHQLRVTIGQCVQDLEMIGKCCDLADMADRVEHLPLR
jgi:hypothetical protein